MSLSSFPASLTAGKFTFSFYAMADRPDVTFTVTFSGPVCATSPMAVVLPVGEWQMFNTTCTVATTGRTGTGWVGYSLTSVGVAWIDLMQFV